jgi:D-3-phosphoglycerate dehydrogenase / 2-oxoglutarate reductase
VISAAGSPQYKSLVTLRSGRHSVAGTLAGARTEPRVVMVDDHHVEVPPADTMLVVHNDDRPGMIGAVGTALGDAGISISNMAVGQTIATSADGSPGTALMILSTDGPAPPQVVSTLRATAGILDVYEVSVPA